MGSEGLPPRKRAQARAATKNVYSKNDDPAGAMYAKFSDGMEGEIADLTCKDYDEIDKAKKSRRGRPALWERVQAGTNLKMKLVFRQNNQDCLVSLLIYKALQEGGKEDWRQLCQVKQDIFKNPEDATKMMTQLAEAVAKKEMSRDELFAERDAFMANYKLSDD